jgi:hypothetical protein
MSDIVIGGVMLQDMGQAAGVEAIAPCRLLEGTIKRKKKRMSSLMEDNVNKLDGSYKEAVRFGGF